MAAQEWTEGLFLSIPEAAKRVGLSEKTIRRAIATTGRHKLDATKIRAQWRIAPKDLADWVASYRVEAAR